jgi:hypothetical protein
MVVIGIAGIVILLHLLGLSRPRRFDSETQARAAWEREMDDAAISRVILCHNHSAALIETDRGPGVVWPMGADSTARYLAGARIDRTPDGIVIHLPDFTAPRIRLELDADEAALWLQDLEHPA